MLAIMKRGPIISLAVCALLVAWFAPNLDQLPADQPDTATASQDSAPEAHVAAARTEQWLSGQTVLNRQNDGHFYADATIDGAKIRLLVDTGASMIALTGEDAEALGLTWDEASLRPIGRGASGTVHGVPVHLERVEIDGIEARGVEAAIIPEGLDVSLLGQSFLSRIDNVQISGDEMRMGG
jgi:aspartyl protease family protein